jgi:hypothetical protein
MKNSNLAGSWSEFIVQRIDYDLLGDDGAEDLAV